MVVDAAIAPLKHQAGRRGQLGEHDDLGRGEGERFGGKRRGVVEHQFGAGPDPHALAADVRAVAIAGRLDIEVVGSLDPARVRERAGVELEVAALQPACVGHGALRGQRQQAAGLDAAAVEQGIGGLEFQFAVDRRDQAEVVGPGPRPGPGSHERRTHCP
jgi:hypothetical protein